MGNPFIPFYIATTAGIPTLSIIIETPATGGPENFGPGQVVGILPGIFAGVFADIHVLLIPFLECKLIENDARLRFWHASLVPNLAKITSSYSDTVKETDA